MKLRFTMVALLLLIGAGTVRADLPPEHWWQQHHERSKPDIVLPPGVPLIVSIDDRATEARLIVPKRHVKQIAAASSANDNSTHVANSWRWPIVGIPIALALAVAGLWLTGLRPTLGMRRIVVLLAVLVLAGVAGVTAWANMRPPLEHHRPVYPPLKGQVTVEVVEEGDAVKLILNRAMLKDLVSNP